MNFKLKFPLLLSLFFISFLAKGQNTSALLQNDTLILQNAKVQLSYLWNEGALKAVHLRDKNTGQAFHFSASESGVRMRENEEKPVSAHLRIEEQAASAIRPAHTSATVETDYGSWKLRRVFRVFPDAPAIRVEHYFSGNIEGQNTTAVAANPDGVEQEAAGKASAITRIELLGIQGNHWEVQAVAFKDVTDQNNNLVHEKTLTLYRSPLQLSGNVFIAEELLSGNRLFIVKESPLGEKQTGYAGYDLIAQTGKLEISGTGLKPEDVHNDGWTRGYGYAIGTGGNSDFASLKGLRDYFKAKSPFDAEAANMIMANTWGDRSRDQRMNEQFILQELEAGAKLGITHLQLDDGWQAGLSKNSGSKAGKLWRSWDKENWMPHPDRFPNGLDPILKKAEALGIQPGLWFNPSSENSFATWAQDAGIIIDLYRKYGIRYFKMDGIDIPDKEADQNLRLMLDSVRTASGGEVFFNLDATAGRRTGYFYLNDYGNIFLENRYTDWGNYYPAWTLRNLWMLSKYVPAENLQIEFLNKWRNTDKYPTNAPLAPANYDFEYLFAITMMAQPLAWMEISSLPEEAFAIAPVVKEYRAIMNKIHAGTILPIGEMPNGFSWTGFQSAKEGEGYLLVFRENNDQEKFRMDTWLEENQKISLSPLLRKGKAFEVETGPNGEIEFSIAKPNSYRLYHYKVADSMK